MELKAGKIMCLRTEKHGEGQVSAFNPEINDINNDSSKWPNLQDALKKTELECTPLVAVKVLRPLGWLLVRQMNESGIRFCSNSEEKSAP